MFCDARMYSEGLGSIMLLLLADCVSSNFFLLSSLHCSAIGKSENSMGGQVVMWWAYSATVWL